MLTRLTGVAIPLIAAIAWPMAALAADPTVETQQNPVIVYIVLILLFAALASGIFFASPLRARLMPSTAAPGRRGKLVTPAQSQADPGTATWSTTGPQQSGPWTQGRPGSGEGQS